MKTTQNLLCCAAVAFVSRRTDTRRGAKRCGSHPIVRKPQLRLTGDDGERDHHRHGRGCHGITYLHGRPKNRRDIFKTVSKYFLASALLMPASAKHAHAACLSGDVRTECIGVYKLPIDAAESPYVDSPEKLKVYAPDLRWVPPVELPPSYSRAVDLLKDQREKLDVARGLVARGDLEKSGLILLDVVPQVSAAGIVIMRSFRDASNDERNAAMKKAKNIGSSADDGNPSTTTKATALEMKAYRIEYALNELLVSLGEMDILIGQGLRGQLGVSAPAQIAVLSQFGDCGKEFDNLLSTVPEKLSSLLEIQLAQMLSP